jgi:hypothetical protein
MPQTTETFTSQTLVEPGCVGLPGGHRLYTIVDSFTTGATTFNIYPPSDNIVAVFPTLDPPQTGSSETYGVIICNNTRNSSGLYTLLGTDSAGHYLQFTRTGTYSQDFSVTLFTK